MWIGILIALIFLTAALVAVATGIYWIMRLRNPLVGLSIIIPSGFFLYFFVSFAAPALMVEILGDPNMPDVSADARPILGEELAAMVSGQIHDGKYYDASAGEWFHYEETYLAGGTIRGKGGPDLDPEMWSWSGDWEVVNNQFCTNYGGDASCSSIFFDGEVYQNVTQEGDVRSWFLLGEPKVVLEPGAEHLTGDDLALVIDGTVHEGMLNGGSSEAAFRMVFYGHNHAIHTLRGADAEALETTEYGWYRLDLENNTICMSGTLGTDRSCFGVWMSGDTYGFVETGSEVAFSTRPAF
jgi:hypothetical protein